MIVPWSLEGAAEEDLPDILAIEQSATPTPWTARHFREELAGEPERRLVVLRAPSAGLPRGVGGYAAFHVLLDEVHIHNIAVHPDLRRRGLGRSLLGVVLDLAARRGARSAYLEVRASNEPARLLYQSHGFRLLQTRSGYYHSPLEDALVLVRTLVAPEPVS